MKKLPVFLILFFASILLWAQAQDGFFDPIDSEVSIGAFNQNDEGGDPDDEEEEAAETTASEKKKPRVKNRGVEFSIANVNVGFANDFISAADFIRDPVYIVKNITNIIENPIIIYHEKPSINLDDFFNGFRFNVDADIKPFSFNINKKDKWGFGLDIGHITAMGNVVLSENVVSLKETKKEKFGVGAAIFADIGIPIFFHVNDFKIKIRPAVYVPLAYTEPGMIYSHQVVSEDGDEGMEIRINYDMRIYTLLDVNNLEQSLADNAWDIPRNNVGYDFGLCIEYPWNPWLDIGVDIVNIPIPRANAKLNHYIHYEGEAWFDSTKIDFANLANGDDIPKEAFGSEFKTDMKGYDPKGKKIYRPFTMLFYANYRPFNTQMFSLIPSLGFSISPLYAQSGSIEGGLSVRFDHANFIITTLGVNYNARTWKNSFDFILNLRGFEFDLGVSLRSQSFLKSWQGAGLGVNFGLKFGW